MKFDLDYLADKIEPLILIALAFVAWQIKAPADYAPALFGAGLAMLKQTTKTTSSSSPQSPQGATQ